MRAGVATHARHANPPRRSSTGCRMPCRVLQEDKVVGELRRRDAQGGTHRGVTVRARAVTEGTGTHARRASRAGRARRRRCALLETDLGAFWRAPLGSEGHTTLSRSGREAIRCSVASLRQLETDARRRRNRRAKKKTRTKCPNPPLPRPRGGTERTVSRTCPRTRREVL